MASGIHIKDEVQAEFKEMKAKKKYRYLLIRVSKDLKEIEIDAKGEPDSPYQEFLDLLKAAEDARENRWAVYDFPYEKNGQSKSKLVFITWNHDSSPVKQKMVYASSTDALSKKLDQAKFVNHDDFSELNEEALTQKILTEDKV